jgi:hypothetical protein
VTYHLPSKSEALGSEKEKIFIKKKMVMYKAKYSKGIQKLAFILFSAIFQLPNSTLPETNTVISCLRVLQDIYLKPVVLKVWYRPKISGTTQES